MKNLKAWLVLRNGEDLRVVKKSPVGSLLPNEMAFELNIAVPQPPQIAGVINLELPEAPTVDPASITMAEWMVGQRAAERAADARSRLEDD